MMNIKKTLRYLQLHNTNGFTLVELIIVIALISMGLAFSGYGLSVLFDANVDAMGNDIYDELRDIRYKTTAQIDTEYQLVFTYSGGSYGYIVEKRVPDNSVVPAGWIITTVKENKYRNTLVIDFFDGTDWVELSTLDPSLNPGQVSIRFKSSNGSVILTSFDGNSNELLKSVDDKVGKFRIRSVNNDTVRVITLIQFTGRVIIDEI